MTMFVSCEVNDALKKIMMRRLKHHIVPSSQHDDREGRVHTAHTYTV